MIAGADRPPPAARHITPSSLLAHTPEFLACVALLLGLLHLFWNLGAAGPAALIPWINSDTLYPVNVTTDVFHDGFALSGWRFSIAPCWVPDLVTTGIFWALTRNAIAATLLAGFIQVPLIAGAFLLLRRTIGMGDAALAWVVLLGTSLSVSLYVAAHPAIVYPDLYRFFLPQSHAGGLIMSLYALALGFLLLARAYKGSPVSLPVTATFAAVCLLAGMSNLMFFPQMLAPFTAVLVLAAFLRIFPARICRLPVVVGWPAAILGAALNRFVLHATHLEAQSQISRESARAALDIFLSGAAAHLFEPLHILALLWIAACAITASVILWRFARRRELPLSLRLLWIFCCSWLFSDLLSAAAIIIGGSSTLTVFKDYIGTTHYLQSIFFVPIFGLPLLCVWLMPRRILPIAVRTLAWTGAAVLLIAAAVFLLRSPAPRDMVTSYQPPLVKFLDRLAARDGLKYGLGGYWQARPATLLSHQGLRVYAITPFAKPFLWVSNADWYTEALGNHRQPTNFRFIVAEDAAYRTTHEMAVQMFGQPSEEVAFEGSRVMIYAHPIAWKPVIEGLDTPLTQFAEQISSSVAGIRARPGETLRIPLRITNPTSERWTSYGQLPVNLGYMWADAGQLLQIDGLRTSLPGQVQPGGTVMVNAQVAIPTRGKHLTLRFSLVQENVAWFFLRGGHSLDIPVEIQ